MQKLMTRRKEIEDDAREFINRCSKIGRRNLTSAVSKDRLDLLAKKAADTMAKMIKESGGEVLD